MKKTVVAIALVSVAFFAACNNDAEADTEGTYPVTEASVEDDHSAQSVSLSTTSGETIDPSAVPAPGSAATGNVKLNPPHGEPGHRCEIPVGAPLDSDPVNSNSNDLVQQQLIQDHAQPAAAQPQPMPAGGQTARLNPPHGQPGHDCAVAVGAPLP